MRITKEDVGLGIKADKRYQEQLTTDKPQNQVEDLQWNIQKLQAVINEQNLELLNLYRRLAE